MERRQIFALHKLIKDQNTGNAGEAAEKLGISRATFFRWCNYLESLGAEIHWIHSWNTYIYGNGFNIAGFCYKVTYEEKGETVEKEIPFF